MPYEHLFGLFIQDEEGPLLRDFYTDLDEAKRKAQELATNEGFEFFVFDFKDSSEIARFLPVSWQRPG